MSGEGNHYPTGRRLTHPDIDVKGEPPELVAGMIEIACRPTGGYTFAAHPDGSALACPFCGQRVRAVVTIEEQGVRGG